MVDECLDFVGYPNPHIRSLEVFNKVMTSTATNQLTIKLLHYELQDFDNPHTLVPTNKNDSTVIFYLISIY